MVTVITRPQGHKIIDQAIAATITEQYGGDAIVNFPYHGLGTGDFVYITSDIDEYNGFWYVTAADVNTFKISEGATTAFVEYYQDAEIEYYQTQEHDWSSIFLPIVYKLSNDLWPVNSNTTVRTVLSSSDDNGFTNLVLSGPIKSFFSPLEFVKVDGGIWQIVEVISTSEIVINMPYDVTNVFTSVQYYYNNYQVKVKIYGGLPASHPWVAKKPYAEVAELSLTPDDDNQVMFSVSDYIKIKVAIKNNLTLFSIPLNLDAFTGFYVSVGESYDQSDGYSLYTSESTFAEDSFEGYAIAGKLPFKNLYSGDYADYVHTSGSPALWLTNHARLLAVEGYYFDVSFIKNVLGAFNLIIDKYASNYLMTTENILHTDQGIGVYRLPITPDANYDSFCVRVITIEHSEEVETEVTEDFDLSLWINGTTPGYDDWNIGIPNPFVNTVTGNVRFLYLPFATIAGRIYTYQYEFSAANTGIGQKTFQLLFLDAGFLAAGFSFIDIPGDGTYSGSVNITPFTNGTYIAINIGSIAVPMDITAIRVTVVSTETETVVVPAETITEEICIDILETCESINQFTQEARRLLEDGGYRLLE